MTILVVSDLHFERGYFHGTYQFGAIDWLLDIIQRMKPSTLIGLGDWGTAWEFKHWELVTQQVKVRAIYGNHDNLELLRSIRNTDGTPILAADGEPETLENLEYGYINGTVGERGEKLKRVPRKDQSTFLRCGRQLLGTKILCTHESPITPELESRLSPSQGTEAMRFVLGFLHPRISFSGHVGHACNISDMGNTLSVIVDSSQASKHFVVLDGPSDSLCLERRGSDL